MTQALNSESTFLQVWALTTAVALTALANSATATSFELPVATSGFEEWAGVVAKAMSFGGRDKENSLQSLKSFQASVAAKMQNQVSSWSCSFICMSYMSKEPFCWQHRRENTS